MTTECDGTKDFRHEKGDGSWWENDAQGIPLCVESSHIRLRCRPCRMGNGELLTFDGHTLFARSTHLQQLFVTACLRLGKTLPGLRLKQSGG